MSDEIARVAEIFGIDRNRLIAESISNFVDSAMSKCEKRIRGVSILEAVSDTRRWKHVIEDLEKEEAR